MKISVILAILMAVITAGCSKPEVPITSNDFAIRTSVSNTAALASEPPEYLVVVQYCYQGFVYGQFNLGNAKWGSVMYDNETKQPKRCEK